MIEINDVRLGGILVLDKIRGGGRCRSVIGNIKESFKVMAYLNLRFHIDLNLEFTPEETNS